jgi:hypothetical protein
LDTNLSEKTLELSYAQSLTKSCSLFKDLKVILEIV